VVVACAGFALAPAGEAQSGSACRTSGPVSGDYQVTVCLAAGGDSTTPSGDTEVTGSFSVTGTNPGIDLLRFHIDGERLLTDFQAPWRFTLPTDRWADGDKLVEVEAVMRDGFASQPAGLSLTFANGPGAPTANDRQFTPSTGTTPAAGKPFVLAAVGDGASGEANSDSVRNLIQSWDPNLFLYLGDVYETGTVTEFHNWGRQYFGGLRSVSNPVVGDNEYEGGDGARGYFDFWNNIPPYYSYDAAGWHFVAIDSTIDRGEVTPGTAQYEWLRDDLESSDAACTIAYMHTPRFNIGKAGYIARMDDVWRLLGQHGVELLLAGHDHTYQRWRPLNADGELDFADGMTQFIVGNGGHGYGPFVRSDARVAASSGGYGAQRMELNPQGAAYRFITPEGVTLDSGSVQCGGTPPDGTAPDVPTGLSATAMQGTSTIELAWSGGSDNVGVTGYEIYRDGNLLTRAGPESTY
jgi:Calcineurin-like phosphoesterase